LLSADDALDVLDEFVLAGGVVDAAVLGADKVGASSNCAAWPSTES